MMYSIDHKGNLIRGKLAQRAFEEQETNKMIQNLKTTTLNFLEQGIAFTARNITDALPGSRFEQVSRELQQLSREFTHGNFLGNHTNYTMTTRLINEACTIIYHPTSMDASLFVEQDPTPEVLFAPQGDASFAVESSVNTFDGEDYTRELSLRINPSTFDADTLTKAIDDVSFAFAFVAAEDLDKLTINGISITPENYEEEVATLLSLLNTNSDNTSTAELEFTESEDSDLFDEEDDPLNDLEEEEEESAAVTRTLASLRPESQGRLRIPASVVSEIRRLKGATIRYDGFDFLIEG